VVVQYLTSFTFTSKLGIANFSIGILVKTWIGLRQFILKPKRLGYLRTNQSVGELLNLCLDHAKIIDSFKQEWNKYTHYAICHGLKFLGTKFGANWWRNNFKRDDVYWRFKPSLDKSSQLKVTVLSLYENSLAI